MTSMSNAFMRALGRPENNNFPKVVGPVVDVETSDPELDEPTYYERMNEHGFMEYGFWENNAGRPRWFPMCSQCQCHNVSNRGQGTICDNCNHQLMVEMSHDY